MLSWIFEEFYRLDNPHKNFLVKLDIVHVYPFIFKAYRIFRNAPEKQTLLEQVFKALEVIAFRDKLIRTRADLPTRLQKALQDFEDVPTLRQKLKEICADKSYWADTALTNALRPEGYDDHWRKNASIILGRYENYLHAQKSRTKGYTINIENPQIEHIAPQTENNEKLKSGYCDYDENFYQNYLHCIGNLLLIDEAHNVSIGNRDFAEKLESYNNAPPLLQQKEIKDFVQDKWDKEAIERRHNKIVDFVLKTWSL
ncbi:hypothetical protein NHP190012_15010 [Helicobacter sp. NHP19-012]|uniref:GmrSD restriction endonucleases C-terminal domain-containing protein n=1 Tax=Helicobacter gastrofelis TaxID=2849642 RepID=A0ABN6IAX7_9HELI|nr:HNH endonuclease family protein [Helicobacter sp. NHP19-012]BCZ19859.1 hypothetical protein NHP190012_15010 [Helicobacter sp. NHP19-012]